MRTRKDDGTARSHHRRGRVLTAAAAARARWVVPQLRSAAFCPVSRRFVGVPATVAQAVVAPLAQPDDPAATGPDRPVVGGGAGDGDGDGWAALRPVWRDAVYELEGLPRWTLRRPHSGIAADGRGRWVVPDPANNRLLVFV